MLGEGYPPGYDAAARAVHRVDQLPTPTCSLLSRATEYVHST